MTDDEKKQAAIDLLISRKYPRIVAEAIVKISGPDKVLATSPAEFVPPDLEEDEKSEDESGEIGEVGEHGYIGDLGTNHPEGIPRPHLPPKPKEEKAKA